MIHRISSSLSTFKTVELHAGLNIVLARREPTATDLQTRNRAGKSSLVEVIHFLTGAQCDPGSIFRNAILGPHSFMMTFDLAGATVEVRRSGQEPSRIHLRLVSASARHALDGVFDLSGTADLSVSAWKDILGEKMFALNRETQTNDGKYRPTFRSIFPYFARRQGSQGFLSPIQHMEGQPTWEVQVTMSWLLGLDWRISQELQVIRDREKSLAVFKKAAGKELDQLIGRLAELRAEVALVADRVIRLRSRIGEFKVLPEYGEREVELNAISRQFAELNNDNVADGALISQIESALAGEAPPAINDVRRVYEEAGLLLPGAVTQKFEQVAAFHSSVVQNRRLYLESELGSARQRVGERRVRLGELDRRRGELMNLLRSHGALAELTELQAELGRREGQLESLRGRYAAAERLETEGARIGADKKLLQLRLQTDHNERREAIERAVVLVRDVTAALYETPGRLLVEATASGPRVAIKIEGDRSKGVGSMEVFAFDLTMMQLVGERVGGTGFLVHDSHLFDGVDGRQKALALMLGRKIAREQGWQYVVTMNEDDLPAEADQPEDYSIEDSVASVALTDETVSGGIFGVRFD